MCLAIYVGSPVKLPLVAANSRDSGFTVRCLAGYRVVRRRLSSPFLYDVRAESGCACAFRRPHPARDPDDMAESGGWDRLMDDFASWLQAAAIPGPCDLLVCWLKDEGRAATRREVQIGDLRGVDLEAVWDRPLLLRVRG